MEIATEDRQQRVDAILNVAVEAGALTTEETEILRTGLKKRLTGDEALRQWAEDPDTNIREYVEVFEKIAPTFIMEHAPIWFGIEIREALNQLKTDG